MRRDIRWLIAGSLYVGVVTLCLYLTSASRGSGPTWFDQFLKWLGF